MAAKVIKLSKKHENQWIALTYPDNKIVRIGKDARTARAAAERKGYKEAFLMKVLPLDSYYAGALLNSTTRKSLRRTHSIPGSSLPCCLFILPVIIIVPMRLRFLIP